MGRLQRQNACRNRRQFGAIRTEPGNLRLRRTAWWGWEDSNFQPNDYQSLALSSRHRWPAPAWHGRRSPHRLAGGMVPTAPDARPSCAIIARALNSISVGGGLRARKRNFCRQRLSAETVSLKFNRLFAESLVRANRDTSGTASQELIIAWLEVGVLPAPPHSRIANGDFPVQCE
jgi:hypothetical protein